MLTKLPAGGGSEFPTVRTPLLLRMLVNKLRESVWHSSDPTNHGNRGYIYTYKLRDFGPYRPRRCERR